MGGRLCNRCPAQPESCSARIVKDHAERVALAGAKSAYSVAHVDAVMPSRSGDRTIAIGEDDSLALIHRDRFATRLRARALLDQQEFSALEILVAPAQHAGELKRERDLAVEILM